VTGQPELVDSPDGRFSPGLRRPRNPASGFVQNNGSAARNVELSGTAPPAGLSNSNQAAPEIPAAQQVEVTPIGPSEGAAGDYMATIAPRRKGASKSADFRITVLTSTLWASWEWP
jgi:hypothetical protein